MPSFDIVSEVDTQELDNAINQARKELATRFDFKGITAEILAEKDKITLTAQDAAIFADCAKFWSANFQNAVSICEISNRKSLPSHLSGMPGRS